MDTKGYKVKHFLPIPVRMLPSCPSLRQSILFVFHFCVHECTHPYKVTSLNSSLFWVALDYTQLSTAPRLPLSSLDVSERNAQPN